MGRPSRPIVLAGIAGFLAHSAGRQGGRRRRARRGADIRKQALKSFPAAPACPAEQRAYVVAEAKSSSGSLAVASTFSR